MDATRKPFKPHRGNSRTHTHTVPTSACSNFPRCGPNGIRVAFVTVNFSQKFLKTKKKSFAASMPPPPHRHRHHHAAADSMSKMRPKIGAAAAAGVTRRHMSPAQNFSKNCPQPKNFLKLKYIFVTLVFIQFSKI